MTDQPSYLKQPENWNKIEKSSIFRQRRAAESTRENRRGWDSRKGESWRGRADFCSHFTQVLVADSGRGPEADDPRARTQGRPDQQSWETDQQSYGRRFGRSLQEHLGMHESRVLKTEAENFCKQNRAFQNLVRQGLEFWTHQGDFCQKSWRDRSKTEVDWDLPGLQLSLNSEQDMTLLDSGDQPLIRKKMVHRIHVIFILCGKINGQEHQRVF